MWIFDVAHPQFSKEPDDNICLLSLDEAGVLYQLNSHFDDYFYVSLEAGSGVVDAVAREYPGVKFSEVVRRLYGRDVRLFRLSGDAEVLKGVREALKKRVGEENLYEDDIRDTIKYLIDNNVLPCTWYEVYGSLIGEYHGINVWRLDKLVPLGEEREIPKLRVLAIDIVVVSEHGEPDPRRDPIRYVVLYDGTGFREYLAQDGSDVELIKWLNSEFNDLDPHVVVSFGGNSVIWPYLVMRGKHLGLKIGLGVAGHEIHQSLFGHFSFYGRMNIDLKEYVEDNPLFELKTLEELAGYVGLDMPIKSIDVFSYPYYWKEGRDELLNYVRWRVETIYKSFSALVEHVFSLSSVTGMPPDYVLTASSGRQAEHYIMRMSRRRNELIPKVLGRRPRAYPGGLVLTPKKGIHSNIAVIDFKSMYPSIIMKYNISPDTIVRESGEGVDYYPEVGVGVRRDVRGILPDIVETLVRERDSVRDLMRRYEPDSPIYRLLDSKQRILKILANTMYGYMGWLGARWYTLEGASLITYLGRRLISESIDKARELGLNIIYGDTDSVFIEYDEDRVRRLLEWIESRLEMEAKIDKIYRKVLFTEAKKRYAGLTLDGRIDIVGLEYVRRDWCQLAREYQYKFIKMVLEGVSRNRLMDEFRKAVNRIREGRYSVDELVIWEQITRDLDEYKANAPHISVARSLSRRGWRIKKGMFIGYIIVKGEGPLYKRAVHYLDVDPEHIDRDYYIKNQLLPVVARVLEPIGISEKTLLSIAETPATGLDRFIRW